MTDTPFFEPWPDPEPEEERHAPDVDLPWMPPTHVAGVVVPIAAVVFRGPDVVVKVTHAVAYRRGLEVHLGTWQRPGTRVSSPSYLPDWRTQEPRIGVRLADGTRLGHSVTVAPEELPEQEAPVLCQTSGSSGGLYSASSWWVHPFPPGDFVEVVVEWEPARVPESSVRLDLEPLRAAAEREDVLWDPAPPPEEGGGWFAFAPMSGAAYQSGLSLSADDPEPDTARDDG